MVPGNDAVRPCGQLHMREADIVQPPHHMFLRQTIGLWCARQKGWDARPRSYGVHDREDSSGPSHSLKQAVDSVLRSHRHTSSRARSSAKSRRDRFPLRATTAAAMGGALLTLLQRCLSRRPLYHRSGRVPSPLPLPQPSDRSHETMQWYDWRRAHRDLDSAGGAQYLPSVVEGDELVKLVEGGGDKGWVQGGWGGQLWSQSNV
ncbi:hypothetical protein LSCM1_07941 [Leishmania martiniquensis]|uniref:Uncharacterized protein n=1 Tax=Leishmania martiniquensis TaxID=1580590 RepID=A0A836I276_9TRYP|nr:hypothetical protein LSCM1_07941 [Leishmania martiniquensis]